MALLGGCRNDQPQEIFTMEYMADFQLQAGLNTLETHFFRKSNLQSTYVQQLDAVGRQDSDIVSITPKYAEISTVFRDEDLQFIRQIFVRVFDPFHPEENQEVFYLDPVPSNSKTVVRPFPGLANVKDIMSQPFFGIEVGISLWQITPITYDMRIRFEMSANVE